MIDEETKSLAALALRKAFHVDFSRLVNAYLEAGEGLYLDTYLQQVQLHELANAFARAKPTDADQELAPNLYISRGLNWFGAESSCGHRRLLEALEDDTAKEVVLQGSVIFQRRDGEWYYTGE
jgi:hypothetical protein